MFRTALIAVALIVAGPALADSQPVGERVEVNVWKDTKFDLSDITISMA